MQVNPYIDMSDEQLAALCGEDPDALEYLLDKYKNLVRDRARYYYLTGADREDLIQEGMIGLYRAISGYRAEKNASFRSFAEMCITRRMITAIKTATRNKHIPLNSYISINKPLYEDDGERTLSDIVAQSDDDPERMFIDKESAFVLEKSIYDTLSPLEKKVFELHIAGNSYREIALKLKKTPKSVDNALQRIKTKVAALINS